MALASTYLNRAERSLAFDRTSVGEPGLEPTQLLAVTNDAVLEYHSSFKKNGEPSSILKKETGYTLVSDTALAADVAASATDFTVDDSSELGASGALAMWGNGIPDYCEFTGNDLATAISGVTGIDYAHVENNTVSLLYALPSDFETFRSEEGYEDGVSVDGRPYYFTSGTPEVSKFAIYDNGTTKYLHFPVGITGEVAVRYNKLPTTVDEETDTVDVPVTDEWFIVWRVVEYCSIKLENPAMQQKAVQKAFEILSSAHKRRNIGKRPRVRSMRRFHSAPTRSMLFDD